MDIKTPLKSLFSVFKQQKNLFCHKIHNLSKSRQKVPMKVVNIAEDIIVSLTLKHKHLLSN